MSTPDTPPSCHIMSNDTTLPLQQHMTFEHASASNSNMSPPHLPSPGPLRKVSSDSDPPDEPPDLRRQDIEEYETNKDLASSCAVQELNEDILPAASSAYNCTDKSADNAETNFAVQPKDHTKKEDVSVAIPLPLPDLNGVVHNDETASNIENCAVEPEQSSASDNLPTEAKESKETHDSEHDTGIGANDVRPVESMNEDSQFVVPELATTHSGSTEADKEAPSPLSDINPFDTSYSSSQTSSDDEVTTLHVSVVEKTLKPDDSMDPVTTIQTAPDVFENPVNISDEPVPMSKKPINEAKTLTELKEADSVVVSSQLPVESSPLPSASENCADQSDKTKHQTDRTDVMSELEAREEPLQLSDRRISMPSPGPFEEETPSIPFQNESNRDGNVELVLSEEKEPVDSGIAQSENTNRVKIEVVSPPTVQTQTSAELQSNQASNIVIIKSEDASTCDNNFTQSREHSSPGETKPTNTEPVTTTQTLLPAKDDEGEKLHVAIKTSQSPTQDSPPQVTTQPTIQKQTSEDIQTLMSTKTEDRQSTDEQKPTVDTNEIVTVPSAESNPNTNRQNGSFLMNDDSNVSSDSEGLVIDQESSYPQQQTPLAAAQPKPVIRTPSLNGFDFNNYLKRKISSTIEEGIIRGNSQPAAKKRRPNKPRVKKNNGDAQNIPELVREPKPIASKQQANLFMHPAALPPLPPTVAAAGQESKILEYLLENKRNKLIDQHANLMTGSPKVDPIKLNMSRLLTQSSAGANIKQSAAAMTPPQFPTKMTTNSGPSTSTVGSMPSVPQSRKKLLCSSCDQFFEDWNLFLHMRTVHKKFTCLYCMGMFGALDRLVTHLEKKHNVSKKFYSDKDDILSSYKNMYDADLYLMCFECEHIFHESEEFTLHNCERYLDPCQICGLRKKCNHETTGEL